MLDPLDVTGVVYIEPVNACAKEPVLFVIPSVKMEEQNGFSDEKHNALRVVFMCGFNFHSWAFLSISHSKYLMKIIKHESH